MSSNINIQGKKQRIFYILFAVLSLALMFYYLSNTIVHFTTERQFPINSFTRFPLTILIFPAEFFSFLFGIYFVYVLMSDRHRNEKIMPLKNRKATDVAVLLPVYNEPKEIIERTLKACRNLVWQGKVNIYLLDDSDNKHDRKIVDSLGKKFGVSVIRREGNRGYKAGNVNNAIRKHVSEEYFVILDSDQAPERDFLLETMDYFSDDGVGFVQIPQHFINNNSVLERATKIGTDIFYRAQSVAKSSDNAVPFCGTNVVVRASAFRKVGGFSYYTSTEDIDLGVRLNEIGYRGVYVPKILVSGFSPGDFNAYSSQQYRWANGNLAILREYWYKLLGGNFPLRYKWHMFFTVGWWVIGLVTLIYIFVPMLSVIFSLGTHHTWLPTSAIYFLFLYALMGISLIYVSLKGRVEGEDVKFSDALIQYSLLVNSLFIYSKAAINSLLLKRYSGFKRTDKSSLSENSKDNPGKNRKGKSGLWSVKWNLALAVICLAFAVYTLYFSIISVDIVQFRTYFPVSLWMLFYSVILFSSIIFVGGNKRQ